MVYNSRFKLFIIVFLSALSGFKLASDPGQHIVLTPLLQTVLDDMKLYKLNSEGDQYLHAGDLYEHSIWTYYAMVELLHGDLPYVQGLLLTERQKEIISLAALLHDIGKAGRKELFEQTHPTLKYAVVKNNDGTVAYIEYYQDRQEHPRICFEYAAEPILNSRQAGTHRTYYMINRENADLIPLNMKQLYDQLGITIEEQQIIAILLGIHYEFGNYKHGKISAANFLRILEGLVQEVDYNHGVLDDQIVRLAILIQAADVKGLVPVASRDTILFGSEPVCEPTHQPTKFANTFEAFGYVACKDCCCSDESDAPLGVKALHQLLEYFHTVYNVSLTSLPSLETY